MPIDKRYSNWSRKKLEAVPEKPGIYEVGGNHPHQDEKVIYIGKSDAEGGVRSRLLDHKRENDFPSANGFRYKLLRESSFGLWHGLTKLFNQGVDWPRVMEEYHFRKFGTTEEVTPIRNTHGPSLTVPFKIG